jgi:hypothetical protein
VPARNSRIEAAGFLLMITFINAQVLEAIADEKSA